MICNPVRSPVPHLWINQERAAFLSNMEGVPVLAPGIAFVSPFLPVPEAVIKRKAKVYPNGRWGLRVASCKLGISTSAAPYPFSAKDHIVQAAHRTYNAK